MAAKPVLRNLLMNETKINFTFSLTAALITAAAYKVGVEYRRKKKIDEFFANYDDEARYERLNKAGVFRHYLPESDE